MSCCNCCTNTLNLGCVKGCVTIFDTGITADAITAGTWILELSFGNVVQYFSTDVLDGEDVIFTLDNLNESYTYTGVIINPAGDIVEIEKDNILYDCIQFTTKIGLQNNVLGI